MTDNLKTINPGCLTQVLKALKMGCLGAEAYSHWAGAGEISRRGFWANGTHEKSGVSRDVSGRQPSTLHSAG
jgi:hypothetical protein